MGLDTSVMQNRPLKMDQTKNCPLTKEDLKNMDDAVKARAYIGFMIDSQISATEYIANNPFNKHWPSHFNSGDSPNGLLQIMQLILLRMQ